MASAGSAASVPDRGRPHSKQTQRAQSSETTRVQHHSAKVKQQLPYTKHDDDEVEHVKGVRDIQAEAVCRYLDGHLEYEDGGKNVIAYF